VNAHFDGGDGATEDGGDLFVPQILVDREYQRLALLIRQLLDCAQSVRKGLPAQGASFGAGVGRGGLWHFVDRYCAALASHHVAVQIACDREQICFDRVYSKVRSAPECVDESFGGQVVGEGWIA